MVTGGSSPPGFGGTMKARDLPVGTVSFLFTDIEGSTRLLQETGPGFRQVLERHNEIINDAITGHHGTVVKNEGDGFFAAFRSAGDAASAAVGIQERLASERWASPRPVRVRIGVHTGEAILGGADYVGIDVHRAARIGAAGHGGQIVLSDVTARLVEHALPEGTVLEDLGMHRLKDLERDERLHQVTILALDEEFPPVRTLTTLKGNLPAISSSFIGRRQERERVISALQTSRLVTITGPAGVGKTALALNVAADVLPAYPDGVWLIEVSRLSDLAHIPAAIARQLHITESPGEPLMETLASRLARAMTLLILDGCEHLVAEVAAVTDRLLQTTAQLRVLVTSREWLSMRGERLVPLDPLPVPDERETGVESIGSRDAVALFVERARTVQPDFTLEPSTAPLVAEICRRVDGIPLAIELAAARLNMLSLAQLLERLDRQFTVLATHSRNAAPHQQTLETTLDWSYDFLDIAEQLLFARLSVFSGGFTIEAVESVCVGGEVEPAEILDLLGRLVETSLVASGTGDPIRYRLLEPIAQYARMRLEEFEDVEELRERHANYYLELAEEASDGILDTDQVQWLQVLDRERYNLRVAIAWLDRAGRVDDVLRMAGALRWYWIIRRDVSEGWRWLSTCVAEGQGPPDLMARAHNGLALLALMRLEFDRAEESFRMSLRLYDEAGDPAGVAEQTYHLSVTAWLRDDLEEARRLGAEAEQLARDSGNRWIEGWTLAVQGTIARCTGDLATAESYLQRSHRVLSSIGGVLDMGWSHLRLGALARDYGDYGLAVERYTVGKDLLHHAGDTLGAAHADAGLGAIAWLHGEHDDAIALYRGVLEGFGLSEEAANNLFELKTMIQGNPSTRTLMQIVEFNRERAAQQEGYVGPKAALAEYLYHMGKTAQRTGAPGRATLPLVESLRLCVDARDGRGVAIAAAALAGLAAESGRHETAARLVGLAEAIAARDRVSEWPPPDEDGYDESVVTSRNALGPSWEALYEEGRTTPQEEAPKLVDTEAPAGRIPA